MTPPPGATSTSTSTGERESWIMFNSEIETSEQVTKFWTDLVDFVPILTFHCSRRIPDADTSSLEPPGTRGMTVYFSRLLLM